MKRYPRQSTVGCTFCDWELDVSPWIACRVLTWPRPAAHLLFLFHRSRNHRDVYPAWKAKHDADRSPR